MSKTFQTPSLAEWLQEYGLVEDGVQPGGSGWSQLRVFRGANGERYLVKQGKNLAPDFYLAEALGLKAMAETNTVKTPKVFAVARDYIVMEFIDARSPNESMWSQLGHQLAAMHLAPAAHFGFEHQTYCGSTAQANGICDDGYFFFAEQRLLPLAQSAERKQLLSAGERTKVEQIAGRLKEWIPPQKPALLHGDLWNGNVLFSNSGDAVLIDPAAYWGWPEADLAMTTLFGAFDDEFYRAYNETRPLESGWIERAPLYNLYHLLNHLLFFGSSYHAQIVQVLRRFA